MCLLTVTPEYKSKPTAAPNRVVVATPKPVPSEPSQPTPVAPHYVTCNGNNPTPAQQSTTKETGRVTENELLQLLLATQRANNSQQQPQQQAQQRPAPPPPILKPREEHHYHHYSSPAPPMRQLRRRRSSASSVSVRSFESVRRKVGGLWQRVSVLERDRERKEWLAEAAAAAAAAAAGGERRRERSRSPGRIVGGVERVSDFGGYGRGRPMRECRRQERCREW
ncbi:hypothetical protein MMC16_001201 [Acarospora aff. strigata]|nr:hypothetical protein [Acarospora aff. strigata]